MEKEAILNDQRWTEWLPFPDPRQREYLYAPFGCGVYQLRNKRDGRYILFGSVRNLCHRMTSLLPAPLGSGTRNNWQKREYVYNEIAFLEYRTISFLDELTMKTFENNLKGYLIHRFNS